MRRFRSTEQAVGLLIGGGVGAVAVLPVATDGFQRVFFKGVLVYAVFLAFLALIIIPASRAGIFVSPDGVEVHNPFSSRKLAWRDIKGFRIGRHGLASAICIIDVTDGSTQHAWGIQVPSRLVGKSDSRERCMIDELNAELAAHTQKFARR